MRIAILLISLFTLFWSYTSWYRYTCKIKWFCNNTNKINNDLVVKNLEKNKNIKSISVGVNSGTLKRIEENLVIKNKEETINISNESTWSIFSEKNKSKKVIDNKIINLELCEDIITKPILLNSKENVISEVKKLEQFLIDNEKENLKIDWIYDKEDMEAVKRLQLKYSEDILKPWNIKNPTWYVYKTTIKKINFLHCLK
jgi:hypothetical protein